MTKAQKRLQELRARQSRERGRMAELSLLDTLTEEHRSELDGIENGTSDLEAQLRAAQTVVDAEEAEQRTASIVGADPATDAEDRERRELRGRVRFGNYVAAAMEQRSADGAEAEYNAALGMVGNRFPLEMLAPREVRASTDVDTATMPRTWLDRLFSDACAVKLGISMESVPVGSASYPVTTAGASAAQRQRATDATADAVWTVGVTEMRPKRNSVRAVFSIEDTARIPGLEAALTRDLRMAMTEGVDRAIFIGDATATGTDANIVGLRTHADVDETTIEQSNKVKGPETLSAFTGMVDGIHASMVSELNVVSAVGAYRLWENTIINSGADNTTLAAFLREAGLSWMARGNIEDDTLNNDFAAFVGRSRGIDGAGVAAVWEAGELIRDPYSDAAKGEVSLTLIYLWDFDLPRPSNFRRVKFVT